LKPTAVICDLDGTLALIGDRDPYAAQKCEGSPSSRSTTLTNNSLS